jgi:hypothetical protein
MLVREYLNKLDAYQNVTFIKAIAQKDENSPFYDEVYQTTPIRQAHEWQNSSLADFYILNHKQCPIDWLSGAKWGNQFKRGHLKSLLIISKEDIEKLYSPKQAAETIKFIEGAIKNDI